MKVGGESLGCDLTLAVWLLCCVGPLLLLGSAVLRLRLNKRSYPPLFLWVRGGQGL